MSMRINPLRVRFYTLGCKLNQYEANAIANMFLKRGYVLSDSDDADIYVVSGCVVTAEAERKTRQFLRRSKRKNPNAITVSVGCYAQMRGNLYADISVGNRLKHKVVDIVESYILDKKRTVSRKDLNTCNSWDELEIDEFYGHTRAWVKIQDGCNHFCSYCVIPLVRGREISRPMERVVNEVRRLVSLGFSEIVLTGVNIGRYGFDWGKRNALVELLRILSNVERLKRLRLSSIEPFTITDELIDTIVELPNVCNHLHIPLQSGDDGILKAMKRGYDSDFFLKLVSRIREKSPQFNITTDLIVGFPGEGEVEFLNSLSLLRKVKFGKVHVFPFSERLGVAACKIPNKVSKKEIKQRVLRAVRVAESCASEFKRGFVGSVVQVITEKKSGSKGEGWSDNYLRVKVVGMPEHVSIGDVVYVKVEGVEKGFLYGSTV